MDLTKNQRKVLYNLECDARSSQNLIARNCGISQQSVSYTVDSLQDQGKIKGFTTLVDYSKLGYSGFLCLFRLENYSRSNLKALKDIIDDTESIGWLYEVSGGFEVAALFLCQNTSQMNKRLKSVVSGGPELSKKVVMPAVAVHEAGKKYLNTGFTDREIEHRVVGADRPLVEVSDGKEKLLQRLNDEPRVSMVEASEGLDVTSKTLIDWRKSMEDQKLIRGYRPVIGAKELEIESQLILFQVSDKSREDELRNYMIRQENIVSVVKTLGSYDMIAEIQAEQPERITGVISTMRETFGDLVEDHRTLDLEQKERKRFLPESHFK